MSAEERQQGKGSLTGVGPTSPCSYGCLELVIPSSLSSIALARLRIFARRIL